MAETADEAGGAPVVSNPVHGTAASGGISAAVVAIGVWVLSIWGISVPPDVAIAAGAILTAIGGKWIHPAPNGGPK